MTAEDAILQNIRKFRASAQLVFEHDDATSATILTFKLLFAVVDYILLIQRGITPKDHGERFRLVQKWLPDLYEILDKDFPVYQDSYSRTIEKEVCKQIQKHVQAIIEKYKIPF